MQPNGYGGFAVAIGLSICWTVVLQAERADAETERQYLGPGTLVASRDGQNLYVACADARQVLWMDLPGGTIARRVNVPAEPTGLRLTPDESRLIVTCAAPQSVVVVLDRRSGETLALIRLGHTAMSPVVSPDGTRLYACNRFDNDISVVDLAAASEVARVAAVREPIAADLTPDGRWLLVANHLPNTRTDTDFDGDIVPVITLVDTETLQSEDIPLRRGANGLRGLRISPDGRYALVTHLLSNFEMVPFRVDTGWINVNVVSIIDIAGRKLRSTIGLDENDWGAGNPWDVCFTADGDWVCVSSSGTRELCVIPRDELFGEFAHRTMQPMMAVWPIYLSLGENLWRRIPLPGEGPRGLASAGSTIYTAEYFSDSVAVLDLKEPPKAGAAAASEAADRYQAEARYTGGGYSGRRGAYLGHAVRTIRLGPPPEMTFRRRGEMLFHDATLCYQHWQSCASCHPDGRVDGLNWDLMNDGQGNPKNTKSMLLAHATPPSMAKGVRATAEIAVRAGFEHILFSYRPEEESAAIDVYLRALEPIPSPFLVDGRLSPAAERGRVVFERVGCGRCHPAPLYTDLKMHNVGTGRSYESRDDFDTPTLVEVWRTAPYLHDGRYVTIRDLFVEGEHGLQGGRIDDLSTQEIDDLVEFVLSL